MGSLFLILPPICKILLFFTIKRIIENKNFSNSLKWERKPYKRKDFHKIFEIRKKDSVAKIKKIIQATNYSDYPGAYVKLANYKFQLRNRTSEVVGLAFKSIT